MRFSIDGREYEALVTDLHRTGKVTESKRSGEVRSGKRFRDLIGTYYSYSMEIATDRLSTADYDALFEVLSAPVESHVVQMPYGHSGYLTYEACVDTVSDALLRDVHGRMWGGLKVNFIAQKPQRRPT